MLKKLSFLVLGLTILAGVVLPSVLVVDNYDMLLLRCNGTGTTFTDDSTANNKTGQITPHGNATQLPIKFNKSAGFFNGTTDYVLVPYDASFGASIGTGNFTMEGFFFFNSIAATVLFDNAYATGVQVGINGSGSLTVYVANTSHNWTWTPTIRTWYHIAMVRTSGNVVIYINGVALDAGFSMAGNITSTANFRIGADISLSYYFNGWVKEFRVSNNARTIALPTTQYTTDANTVLLMHFDTPATSPLGPAIAFDGTGDYLELASNSDWAVGTGAFSVEGYYTEPATNSGYRVLWDSNSATGIRVLLDSGAGTAIKVTVGGTDYTFARTFIANSKHHIEVTRSGTSLYCWLDGRQIGSTETSSHNLTTASAARIGLDLSGSLSGEFLLREFRFSNVARHTSTFTPSQTGFTVDSNTKLYIKGNENNGVTTFVDSETTPKTVTTAGDTKIKYTEDYRSCIFKDETGKFPYPVGSAKVDFFAIGSGVGYFDGTNSYLTCGASTDFDLGTAGNGAFTLEGYFRFKVVNVEQPLFNTYQSSGWQWYWVSGYFSDGAGHHSSSFTPLVNTWYHYSLTRTAGTVTIWTNGTSLGTITDSDWTSGGVGLSIGSDRVLSASSPANMLGDNIRISKGVARYTTTFNPSDDYNAQTVNGQMLSVFN